MIALAVAFMAGTCFGIVLMGLMGSASQAEDEMDDAYLRRVRHSCGPKCIPQANIHRDVWQ